MTNRLPNKSREKTFLYFIVSFFIVFSCLIFASEIMVRVLVPKEIYLPITNIFKAVDSSIGYTYKPNYNGTAFGVDLKTNSLGFRGTEWPREKSNKTFRIALIGDSHAFGYGVPFKDTIGEKLAALLRQNDGKKFEVLNWAVSGHNSIQELNVLQYYALKYHPDLIIVIPCSNDHEPTLNVDADGYLNTSQGQHVRDYSIGKLSPKTLSWLSRRSKLIYYLIFLKRKYGLQTQTTQHHPPKSNDLSSDYWMGPFPDGPVSQRLKETVYHPLKTMIAEAKSRNIPIILANFNAFLDYRQMFKTLALEENIPSIELLALFPEAKNWEELQAQYSLGWNNHLNAKAHQRWAVALYELIKKNQLIN